LRLLIRRNVGIAAELCQLHRSLLAQRFEFALVDVERSFSLVVVGLRNGIGVQKHLGAIVIRLIQIDLRLTSVQDDDTIGDPATARASLDGLASALGASMQIDFSEREWQVRLAMRR